MIVWLIRPGIASILIPNEGIDHEWITSKDLTNKRIWLLKGKIKRLSTSKRRNKFLLLILIMNESNSIFLRLEYSNLQYHWWPKDLMVNEGINSSSVKYKIFKEGIAI